MPKYPGQIDDNTSLPTAIDNVTPVKGSLFNRLRDATIAIEAELGTKPSSVYGSVKSRLDNLENNINNINAVQLNNDLGGTVNHPLVIGIQGNPITTDPPSFLQNLTWNGIAWAPQSNDLKSVLFGGNSTDGYGIVISNNDSISGTNYNITGTNINLTSSNDLSLKSSVSGAVTIYNSSSQEIIKVNNTGVGFFGITPAVQPKGLVQLSNIGLTSQYSTSVYMASNNSSIPLTTLISSAPAGLYQVDLYLVGTNPGTGGSVFATVSYTDDGGANSLSSGTLTFGGIFRVAAKLLVELSNNKSIQYQTTANALTGGATYSLRISVIRIT